jgi:hypothetical protein
VLLLLLWVGRVICHGCGRGGAAAQGNARSGWGTGAPGHLLLLLPLLGRWLLLLLLLLPSLLLLLLLLGRLLLPSLLLLLLLVPLLGSRCLFRCTCSWRPRQQLIPAGCLAALPLVGGAGHQGSCCCCCCCCILTTRRPRSCCLPLLLLLLLVT